MRAVLLPAEQQFNTPMLVRTVSCWQVETADRAAAAGPGLMATSPANNSRAAANVADLDAVDVERNGGESLNRDEHGRAHVSSSRIWYTSERINVEPIQLSWAYDDD